MGASEVGAAAQPKYSAFISYSHADAAAVRKLHARLESYRLPKGVGSAGADGASKARLGKVFRDREDLSAAENLSDAITDALCRSDVLVVVCSPEAKASRWVGQEIAFFREHCPGRPILAAIVRGEPGEAFPAHLTEGGTEPLAADLRKEGDGWKLGFLKVVAGIAGVPLDSLIQRDSQRQLRRVMAITGATGLVAIAMAAMTTVAIQARNEAQDLRRNSDEFINELLTDGRQDLIGVGRIDVLDKFNDRALRFYERQGDPADLPDDSLGNWSRILHAIGEDETKKTDRDLDKAERIFRSAFEATEELLKRDPRNPDRIFEHAQSTYWMGRVDALRGDFSAAEGEFVKYRDLSRRLAKVEANSLRAAMERGFGEMNLGVVQFRREQLDRAGESFDKAISWFGKAVDKDPANRSAKEELANSRAWRFDVHYALGEFDAALRQRLKGAEVSREIVARNPDDMEAKFALLIAERAIAMTRQKIEGQPDQAETLADLVERATALSASDPENEEWSRFEKKVEADYRLSKSKN